MRFFDEVTDIWLCIKELNPMHKYLHVFEFSFELLDNCPQSCPLKQHVYAQTLSFRVFRILVRKVQKICASQQQPRPLLGTPLNSFPNSANR
jgi:hypothetical protein